MTTFKTLQRQLAKGVRTLRLARRWTQEELADKAGLHRSYLSRIERARANVRINKLDALARALDAAIVDLFKR
jgi:transcriptional regulator with XRE-family HTH domain